MEASKTITLSTGDQWTCKELTVSDSRRIFAGNLIDLQEAKAREDLDQTEAMTEELMLSLYMSGDDVDPALLLIIYDKQRIDLDPLTDADLTQLEETARRVNPRFFAMAAKLGKIGQLNNQSSL